MLVTRYLRIVCPSCSGKGKIGYGDDQETNTFSSDMECKACEGKGYQNVIEQYDECPPSYFDCHPLEKGSYKFGESIPSERIWFDLG